MGNEPEKFLQSEFVRKYWDARVFGNTFLEDGGNKGFIKTGVVQFSMGLSLAPVDILRQTNTNEAGVQEGKMQAWRRWPIGLWSMASTVCRFS